MNDIHCKCSIQLSYDVLVCPNCRRPVRFPGVQALERRVEELEAESGEMKRLLQQAERKMDFQAKQALKDTGEI